AAPRGPLSHHLWHNNPRRRVAKRGLLPLKPFFSYVRNLGKSRCPRARTDFFRTADADFAVPRDGTLSVCEETRCSGNPAVFSSRTSLPASSRRHLRRIHSHEIGPRRSADAF